MRFSTPFTLLLASLPIIATAQSLSEEDALEEYAGLDANEALMMDAEIIAEENGWSVRDTVTYLETQADFSELAATIAENYPNDYSSGTNLMHPMDAPELYFKGEVPAGVQGLIDTYAFEVEVHEHTGMNATEWDDRVQALAGWLRADGQSSFAVAFDGVDSIEVILGNGVDVPTDLPTEYTTSDIRFESVPGAVAEKQGVHGGGDALISGDTHWCTFGWCVEDSNGVRGVLTAGHCDYLVEYENPDTAAQWPTTLKAAHEGSWGDFEWHTTTGSEWPNWIADENWTKRRMDGIKTFWLRGDATCVFGLTTLDRKCTTVHRTGVSIDNHNMMVVTVDLETLGGEQATER